MLFEASDTCAPACPALHTVRFSFLFLHLLPRSEISLPRAILPLLLHTAKRHNVHCRPATVPMLEAHARNVAHGNVRSTLHVTYGVFCIKMRTMIRTTLRSHAPTIHSPADVWTVVVYRSSRAACRSIGLYQRANPFFRVRANEKRNPFGENAHRGSSGLIMDQRRWL